VSHLITASNKEDGKDAPRRLYHSIAKFLNQIRPYLTACLLITLYSSPPSTQGLQPGDAIPNVSWALIEFGARHNRCRCSPSHGAAHSRRNTLGRDNLDFHLADRAFQVPHCHVSFVYWSQPLEKNAEKRSRPVSRE